MTRLMRRFGSIAASRAGAGAGAGLVAGALAHWDVSDAASVTLTGSRIDQINDQTGNGEHVTLLAGTPSLVSAGQNGLDHAACSSVSSLERILSVSRAQPFTVQFVGQLGGGGTISVRGGTGSRYVMARASGGNDYTFFGTILGNTVGNAGAWTVFSVTANGGASELRFNLTVNATGAIGANGLDLMRFLDLDWGEAVVYAGVLSTTDLEANITHLKSKWGIP